MGKLVELLNCPTRVVAVYRTDKPPEGERASSDIHCIIGSLLMPAAKDGKTMYAEKKDIGCTGAFSGLGFGGDPTREDRYVAFSTGNDKRTGRHYFKDPDTARKVMDQVPVYGDGTGYIVFQPIEDALRIGTRIETVVFVVDPVRLAALSALAGYDRESVDSNYVRMVNAFSCEEIYALPRSEGAKEEPRAIIGLTEFYTRRYCKPEEMTFAVPYSMFRRMDDNAEESFLNTDFWPEKPEKRCDYCGA